MLRKEKKIKICKKCNKECDKWVAGTHYCQNCFNEIKNNIEIENKSKEKVVCQICNKEFFKGRSNLQQHIKENHPEISDEVYYIKYININPQKKCKYCDDGTKFVNLNKGFAPELCGKKICAKRKISISTSERLKGKQLPIETKKKIKMWFDNHKEETRLKNIELSQRARGDKSKQKRIKTNLEKHGVINSFQTEIGRNNHKNYRDNPQKIKEMVKKSKKTCLKKYGIENAGVFAGNPSRWQTEIQTFLYNQIPDALKDKCNCQPFSREFFLYDKQTQKSYGYDFIIRTPLKICIEFNGTFWHFDEKIYNDENKIYRGKTVKEHRAHYQYKKELIIGMGFKYLEIWESEYKENKEAVIKKCMDFINDNTK